MFKVLLFIVLIGFNCYMISKTEGVGVSFQDCFKETSLGMYLFVNEDPNDPKIQSLVTNLCNFYHDKTGSWITPIDNIDPQLAQEFLLKYKDTFPNSLLNLIN